MGLEYKKIKILFDEENGLFTFFNQEKKTIERSESLKEAKRRIDEIQKNYYDFTFKDMEVLLKKLDNREKDFVVSLIRELNNHNDNAYCELNITDEFLFDFGFYEFIRLWDQDCQTINRNDMKDGYLSEEWYPDCMQIENKEFPLAPQTDDYRYYQVLFEGNNYWCYVEVHKDYNTKVVGFLSIDADGPEGAVIVPAPCKSFDIDEDDKEILNQFLEKYKGADVLGARKADMLKTNLNKEKI